MFDFSAEAGLWGLFISAFVSATILPGNSEIVLVAVLAKHPQTFWAAIAVATIGNTLGGITSYWLGRLIPDKADSRALNWLRRYGSSLLLLSWVPLVGDAICVAAGWLRLPAWRSALLLAIGKLARYLIIAGGWTWFAVGFPH
ncbi:MAG TPA: YqaA family protein [Usitatibacteraceae bacterium]